MALGARTVAPTPRLKSDRGSILVLAAIMLTTLLGVASLMLSAGQGAELRQRLSSVADSAAVSAALEVQRGNSANLVAFAQREVDTAVTAGQLPSGVVVTARLCSNGSAGCTGNAAGSDTHVEVILEKNQNTAFGTLLGVVSMTPRARAVAGVSSSSACIYALASSGVGINIANNAEMDAPNCSIMANSSASNGISVGNNGDIDATGGSVGTTGNCSIGNNGSVVPSCQSGVPPANDPLAGLPAPTAGTCATYSLGNNATGTISPGTYCSISLSNNATLTMNAGVYVINNGFNLGNNSTVTANGVMLYNVSGTLSMSNNSTLTLTAPTSGTYAGIALFQPASNTNTFTISNNATLTTSGALYFPGANVSIANNGGATTDCNLIVAQRITLSNNAGVSPRRTCSAFGGSPFHQTALAE